MKEIIVNDNQGFTLVELIVVIAIMGVILILALPQISKLQSANKDKKYDAYYSSFESGAKLYMDSQAKDLFGSNSSGCVTVDYSDLKKQNLVKDFGSSDVTCGRNNETYVEVRKVNDNFLYSTSLVCRDSKDSKKIVYERKEVPTEPCTNEPDKAGPTVNITPSEHDWVQTKNLKIKIKITDAYTLNKNIGILYYWTNSSGTKVSKDYTYSYKNKKGVKSVSYQIPTKNIPTASGQYKLVVRQWISSSTNGIQDALGNQTVGDKVTGLYKIDNVKPTCESNDGKTTWTNQAFTIKQYCSDDASGCTENPYSKKFTSSTKTYTFTIKDRAGNTNTCKANVYLDVDKPTCGTNDGKTSWVNKDYTANVNCKDTGGSGCSQSKFSKKLTTDGRTDSITIRDVAGNTTSCTVNKYLDKTKPTCGGITGQSTSWTKDNRTISVKCSDNLSGCTKSSFSTTFDYSAKTDTITIKDSASNTRSCTVNVYVDKTAPSAPTSGSIGSVSGSSKNASIKTAASGSKDDHSGVKRYLYMVTNSDSKPSKDSTKFTTSKAFTRSCGTSYYAWAIAEDKVGNRSAVKSLGSTKDGANKYSGWSGCSAKCPTTSGKQTRTNSCALVTSDLSKNCTIECCSPSNPSGCDVMYVCKGATYFHQNQAYSTGSQTLLPWAKVYILDKNGKGDSRFYYVYVDSNQPHKGAWNRYNTGYIDKDCLVTWSNFNEYKNSGYFHNYDINGPDPCYHYIKNRGGCSN